MLGRAGLPWPAVDLEEEVDRLYGLEPAQFVGARDELARRLRAEGRREDATEVKGLRRPSPAAWAVNRLARAHRDELGALVELGGVLRQAQESLLAGQDDAELRDAARQRRAAVTRLAELAGSPPHRDQVIATLEAASVDPEAAEQVLAGRLTAPLSPPSGFTALAAMMPAGGPPPRQRQRERRREEERRAEERAAASAAVDAAQRALEEAETLVARRRRALEAAREALAKLD